MPLPKPRGSESHDEFVSRCMANDVMNSEFPDQRQRAAICNSIYRDAKSDDLRATINAAIKLLKG